LNRDGQPKEERKAKRWRQKYKNRRFFCLLFFAFMLSVRRGDVRGMVFRRLLPIPLTIIPLTNLLENE
jgi:hypothetical protein